MQLKAMNVLVVGDEDLHPLHGFIDGLYGREVSKHLVQQADMVIHGGNGTIYKSRYTVVPSRTAPKDDGGTLNLFSDEDA